MSDVRSRLISISIWLIFSLGICVVTLIIYFLEKWIGWGTGPCIILPIVFVGLIIYCHAHPSGISWTAVVVFLLIYGPVLVLIVIGGQSCKQANKNAPAVDPFPKKITKYGSPIVKLTGNVPILHWITCQDYVLICAFTTFAGTLQIHTVITFLLAYLLVKCFEKITVCCREIKAKINVQETTTPTQILSVSIRTEKVDGSTELELEAGAATVTEPFLSQDTRSAESCQPTDESNKT